MENFFDLLKDMKVRFSLCMLKRKTSNKHLTLYDVNSVIKKFQNSVALTSFHLEPCLTSKSFKIKPMISRYLNLYVKSWISMIPRLSYVLYSLAFALSVARKCILPS